MHGNASKASEDTTKLVPKDVYERSCSMFVYFLDWRNKLFAGYIASMAAIAVAFYKMPSQGKTLAGALIVLSLVFWMIDFRIRDLYRHCSKAAAALERESGQPGSFVNYEEGQKKFHFFRHSVAFDILILSVVCFALGYMLLGMEVVGSAVLIAVVFAILPRVFFERPKVEAAAKAAKEADAKAAAEAAAKAAH